VRSLPQKTRVLVVVLVLPLLLSMVAVATPFSLSGSSPPQAYAVSSATAFADDTIALAEGQSEFSFPLTIEYAGAFAGVELAIQSAPGVEITEITYSTPQSKVGPTSARGLVWFATFAGDNVFANSLVATVHATYRGEANTQVVLDHAAFYTKDGSAFNTLNVPLRTIVTINREGAGNTPDPLIPPDNGTNTAPGSGNPGSGALIDTGNSGSSGAGSGGSANSSAASRAAVAEGADANAAGTDGGDSSSQGTSALTIPFTSTPLGENAIAADNATPANTVLLVFAIVCFLAVIVLGCLLIKRHKSTSENVTKKEVF
jgi:hypothetical protein